jgi:hypothetical protein
MSCAGAKRVLELKTMATSIYALKTICPLWPPAGFGLVPSYRPGIHRPGIHSRGTCPARQPGGHRVRSGLSLQLSAGQPLLYSTVPGSTGFWIDTSSWVLIGPGGPPSPGAVVPASDHHARTTGRVDLPPTRRVTTTRSRRSTATDRPGRPPSPGAVLPASHPHARTTGRVDLPPPRGVRKFDPVTAPGSG